MFSDYHQQGAHQGSPWPFRLGPLQHGEQPRARKRGVGCEETVGGRKVRKICRRLEELKGLFWVTKQSKMCFDWVSVEKIVKCSPCILQQFSSDIADNASTVCLAHLFTYQDFDQGTLGLAYVAPSKPQALGGLCPKRKNWPHKSVLVGISAEISWSCCFVWFGSVLSFSLREKAQFSEHRPDQHQELWQNHPYKGLFGPLLHVTNQISTANEKE